MIRENAPLEDRRLPALAAPAKRPTHAKGFVDYSRYAQTLDELRIKCGPHGEAAVQEALWCIIMAWLMRDVCGDGPALSNPYRAVLTSVMLVQDSDRVRLGYPSGSNSKPHHDPLPALSPDCQAEARLVAAETMADWERAGRPHLTANRMKTIQQFVQVCLGHRQNQEIAA